MPSVPVICSVVSKSHLGFARALVRSFRRFHPEGRAYVLVTDEPEGLYDPAAEEFTVVSLGDLRLRDPRGFCFRYEPFELCNALKPYLLLHLQRERGEERLLYLDSDIGVFGDLAPLTDALEQSPILLTPHTTVDYPADGRWPFREVLLTIGVHNAGVIGVDDSAEAQRFLRWWADVLEVGCIVDQAEGIFVDQHYLDLAPALFEGVRTFKHDGVNVAHFNLHGRRLRREGDRWFSNDVPLLLFHFTQVNWPLLGFYSRVDRPHLAQQPVLKELLAGHREELRRADFERLLAWPNSHARFADGTPLTAPTRKVFRNRLGSAGQAEDPFCDPRWLTEQRRTDRKRRVGELLGLPGRGWAWLRRRVTGEAYRG